MSARHPDRIDTDIAQSKDKVEILPGHAHDLSAATFCLHNEDHTLGNALRYIIMKNPNVEFCGYSNPHPAEPKIHLRIQMYDNASAVTAFYKGLADLEDLFDAVEEKYSADLAKGDFERFEDPKIDVEEAIRRRRERMEQ